MFGGVGCSGETTEQQACILADCSPAIPTNVPYTLVIQTSDASTAGTNGLDLVVSLIDHHGREAVLRQFDEPYHNDLEKGQTDSFERTPSEGKFNLHSTCNKNLQVCGKIAHVYSIGCIPLLSLKYFPVSAGFVDIDELKCIRLVAYDDDQWLFTWISVKATNSEVAPIYFYNWEQVWMSSDESEGSSSLDICKLGDSSYSITTVTSTTSGADTSDSHVTLEIRGTESVFTTPVLDTVGREEFQIGHRDVFTFHNMPDVGSIVCVTVKVDSSDAWALSKLILQKGAGDKLLFLNPTPEIYLSNDVGEGARELEICDPSVVADYSISLITG